jgi:hypothetical protein
LLAGERGAHRHDLTEGHLDTRVELVDLGPSGHVPGLDMWMPAFLALVQQGVPASSVGGPARHHHAMAYDAKEKRLVVFGGSSDAGERWVELAP